MEIIPSIDLRAGRSRLVWWPGASSGTWAPTDRPAVIAAEFVAQGASTLHLVDLDGAAQGRPANLEAIGSVARAVARPLQLAGGIDGPEQIQIAFAVGATRVVVPLWAVAEDHARLADCLAIAGDWFAVGLDGRPESIAGYPWRRGHPPALRELVSELYVAGVGRFVISHVAGDAAFDRIGLLTQGLDAEILVAGGVTTLEGLRRAKDAGVAGVILGEALFTGAIDLAEAGRTLA